jgi:hypothetical protein
MPNAIGTEDIDGITFSQQLRNAGLAALPFTFTSAGTFHFDPSVTQVQRDQILGLHTKHDPLKGRLVSYANEYQWDLASGGFTTTIEGVRRTFDTSSESQSLIDSTSRRLSQPGGPASVDWQFEMHAVVTVQAQDFIVAAAKVTDFVHATFSVLQDTFAGIDNGTITNEGDVNKMPWPEPVG